MARGAHVLPHAGPSNARARIHCGLRVPPGARMRVGDEVVRWKEGECFAWAEACEHEVWYDGDPGAPNTDRVVLIVDVPNALLADLGDYLGAFAASAAAAGGGNGSEALRARQESAHAAARAAFEAEAGGRREL